MAVDPVDVCAREGENKDEIGFGSAYEAFTDEAEVREIIEKVKIKYNDEPFLEMLDERFGVIIDKYQEQPHLLDPYLENLLAQLLNVATAPAAPSPLMHQCFKFLYKITKARGYKVIVRHLPHEVADLEPVLALLIQQNPNESTWETRYMLLLWLSIIVMIPFHLTRLDNNISNDSNAKKPIMDRILDIGKYYLGGKDKPQDAAAYLLSRFVTRPDVKDLHLKSFINWALDSVCAFDGTALSRIGELVVLALLFKHGKREDILTHAAHVLNSVLEKDFKSCNNTTLRKLSIKLTQRIGMTFLKPRVALWRYQRGSRSLETNLSAANLDDVASDVNQSLSKSCGDHEDEEDFDVPEEVESVLQELLNGLKDKETIIRWSAAKGVGRVTNRLPKELADEVVGSVLELFSIRETDSAWHGGCLALAELGRRGILLPERLPDVVPVIVKALVYDEQKGSFSVGDHIRDAACYVCWAFARAYDPQEIKPYVNQIASALLITTVFDREIHCRRAASAAFQENVGRQGTFPHGIDIVTTADYFAVGNRNNAFLNLSVYIAQFPEYTLSLINHLLDHKINHWDAAIRELAALALHGLTRKSPEYMTNEVLPKLIPMATGLDLNTRHGSIFAVAEIIHSLTMCYEEKSCDDIIGTKLVQGIKDIVPILWERKLFRGLGGELMKIAIFKLIEKAALSKLPFHSDTVIEIWQSLIDDCLRQGEIKVLTPLISALTPFCQEYYCDSHGGIVAQKQELLINNYIHELQTSNENTRMGFCMALGALPAFMLTGKFSTIIAALIGCTKITSKDASWANSRKEALNALSAICCKLGAQPENSALCSSHWDAVLECFLEGLQDYTIDNCGDIGSYVRKAAMCGLQDVVGLIVNQDPDLISPNLSQRIICGIAQQAVEKIERVRDCAGSAFGNFLHSEPEMPHIPHKEELLKFFPKSECKDIKWSRPGETFDRFTKMLSLPTYKYHLLLGFSMTAGGLTAHLIIDTMSAFSHYFQSLDKEIRQQEIGSISDTLVQIFEDNIGDPRVTIPLMKTIDQLLSSGHFDDILQEPEATFGLKLFEVLKKELSQSADPNKIMTGLTVLCELLRCASICRNKVLGYFCIMLCHRYPRIRKDAASKLFTAVVSYENVVSDDVLDEVTTLLSETDWGGSVNDLRSIRNKLCDLLRIPKPIIKVNK